MFLCELLPYGRCLPCLKRNIITYREVWKSWFSLIQFCAVLVNIFTNLNKNTWRRTGGRTHRHAGGQTDENSDKKTKLQTYGQTEKMDSHYTHIKNEGLTDRHLNRQTDGWTEKRTGRHLDKWIYIDRKKQTDGQISKRHAA